MTLIPASRQIFSASASLGTTARAAGVSNAAPEATKSFCMSTTIIAVFFGSITSICIIYLLWSDDSPWHLTFALTCDGAFLLRARRRQVQRVVRQRALSLGGPPWFCRTAAAQSVLHRQV